jgi:hypothetical protein
MDLRHGHGERDPRGPLTGSEVDMQLSMELRSRDGHPLRGASRTATLLVTALSVVALLALVTAACAGSAGACTLNPARAVVRLCPLVPSAVAAVRGPVSDRAYPSLTTDAVARGPFYAASVTAVPLAFGGSRQGIVAAYDPLFGRLVI